MRHPWNMFIIFKFLRQFLGFLFELLILLFCLFKRLFKLIFFTEQLLNCRLILLIQLPVLFLSPLQSFNLLMLSSFDFISSSSHLQSLYLSLP